jgi:FAD/FMN-containing dehydrogenase
MRNDLRSWNRIPAVAHARVIGLNDRDAPLERLGEGDTRIAFGNGRSYGDVCLNPGQTALLTRGLDKFMAFDRQTGELTCEGGVLLAEVLALTAPMGWFLPVTPGTRFATIGGAIANDVHGKNHHVAGSFGDHVVEFELLRSNDERLRCNSQENPELFAATIGGLGLTGLIVWATIKLMPVANAFMTTEARKFSTLDQFWALNEEAERDWPYTVSWIDCASRAGRGILFSGAHAPAQSGLPGWKESGRTFPVDPPISLVNSLSLRAFNFAYYRRPLPRGKSLVHFTPYFYPLDSIRQWNRIYGRKGFFQYQCVLPRAAAKHGVAALIGAISTSGTGSFLAVLKTFGERAGRGLLSFPRPGATLALDFPNQGELTLKLFARLDSIVREAGGALYPAKDARMPGEMFRLSFPGWQEFASFVDPGFSSGFWRRVTQTDQETGLS